MQKITTCLWFDKEAEAAVKFYTEIFPGSEILATVRYPGAGQEIHGNEQGAIMTIDFTLCGRRFTALNGGPDFKFNEATSQVVNCDTQQEIDEYWNKLGDGGDPQFQQCGWLKDKFGVSWQIVPSSMNEFFKKNDPAASNRAMSAMLKMKKLDIAELERAAKG